MQAGQSAVITAANSISGIAGIQIIKDLGGVAIATTRTSQKKQALLEKVVYKNLFATNHPITDNTVANIVLAGRTHSKVENENNNTLKTQGYNLEHKFGHGKWLS